MKGINWSKATFILIIALLMTITGTLSVAKINSISNLDKSTQEEACKAKGAEYYNSGEYDCINSKGSPIILNPHPAEHVDSILLFGTIFVASGVLLVVCLAHLYKALTGDD